jgi:hypothetical protein
MKNAESKGNTHIYTCELNVIVPATIFMKTTFHFFFVKHSNKYFHVRPTKDYSLDASSDGQFVNNT